jgi:DnaK suppressor protein
MSIDTGAFKQRLLAKEQELNDEIVRFSEDARESQTAEVEDPIDEVTSSQAKAGAFGVTNVAVETLNAVRAALQRIETGEYGICIDCGRPIEEKRLEAVPWTPYCLEDQEKHDREQQEPSALDSVL